jgi:hypothetical protein
MSLLPLAEALARPPLNVSLSLHDTNVTLGVRVVVALANHSNNAACESTLARVVPGPPKHIRYPVNHN